MISLTSATCRLELSPADGGRWSSLVIHGRELIVRGTCDDPPTSWGNYPLVPFGGRIRRGRFDFEGETIRLPADFDGHAIHGTGYLKPWQVDELTDRRVVVSCDLGDETRWPFGGTSTQTWELSDDRLLGELSVTAGERAMPAQVGWHPWFVKPDTLGFEAGAMYRRDDDYIAVDELVPVPPGPWDDCFAQVTQPVILEWPEVRLELRSDCDDWVVYDQPNHATCVEPMSGPPDAFTLRPIVVQPGESLQRWFELRW